MTSTDTGKDLFRGVLGFFFLPKTKAYIEFPYGIDMGHHKYIKTHPELFGVSIDELEREVQAIKDGTYSGPIPQQLIAGRLGSGVEYDEYITYRYKVVRGISNPGHRMLNIDAWSQREVKAFLQFWYEERGTPYRNDIIDFDVMILNGALRPISYQINTHEDLLDFMSPNGKLGRQHMIGLFAEQKQRTDYRAIVEGILGQQITIPRK